MSEGPETFHRFDTLAEAVVYRRSQGIGGWIFEDEINGESFLFPPTMMPSRILRHALTWHRNGRLHP